jgi:hypothetical protein
MNSGDTGSVMQRLSSLSQQTERGAMSALGHSRPSHFVPVLNNIRYASDSDHSRYESELTLWAKKLTLPVFKDR